MQNALAVYLFAIYYARLFAAPDTTGTALTEGFDTRCSRLGFSLDQGQQFIRAWSRAAFYRASALQAIIKQVGDWQVLGTAIYSHWYSVTFWPNQSLLDPEQRDWFLLALRRLAELAQSELNYPLAFQGNLQSFTLLTHRRRQNPFIPVPDPAKHPLPAELPTQQLSVDAQGHVVLQQADQSRPVQLNLPMAQTNDLLEAMATYFSEADSAALATVLADQAEQEDISQLTALLSESGCPLLLRPQLRPVQTAADQAPSRPGWDLTLVNSADQSFCYAGPLSRGLDIFHNDLSDLLRDCLKRDDLWAFDGNPDRIFALSIYYHRVIFAAPGRSGLAWSSAGSGLDWAGHKEQGRQTRRDPDLEPAKIDVQEQLSLNARDNQLVYTRQLRHQGRTNCIYELPWHLKTLLEALNPADFTRIRGNPPDAQADLRDLKRYKIHLYTYQGSSCIISGGYDQLSLPEKWPEFIASVFDLLQTYTLGDLFDPALFHTPLRRQSDLAFYYVSFNLNQAYDEGKTYCYLAKGTEYRPGDWVVVPTGPGNRETPARIVSVVYRQAADAPYPVSKLKLILRKYESKPDLGEQS
ncbi:MAG: hypothetical protein PHR21_03030 [Oscillospiraceae bacterium]|nr:hypothetical protein [Oscillospiraceae bacterium]MDD4368719.1 hypothetical protein [Oscillospiraceae bacterium]